MPDGILYVISNNWIRDPKSNITPYKIGITKNSVGDRYYGLGLKMPGTFETLFAYKLDNYEKAEQLIHGILHKYRVNGEWFTIDQGKLDLIKSNCEAMGGILVTDIVEGEIAEDEEDTPDVDKIIKEKVFIHENKEYIARLYKNGNSVYGGIFCGDAKCRNMKSIVREYLKANDKNIILDSNINTHSAVKKLIDLLE